MPTSASTGTGQLSTAGGKPSKKDEKAAEVAAAGVKPDHAPKVEQTPKQAKRKGSELNSPDGAPIKTDPDDVQPGDRADLPPSPPQDNPQPPSSDALNGNGIVQASRPDGSQVVVDASQDGWEDEVKRVRKG